MVKYELPMRNAQIIYFYDFWKKNLEAAVQKVFFKIAVP